MHRHFSTRSYLHEPVNVSGCCTLRKIIKIPANIPNIDSLTLLTLVQTSSERVANWVCPGASPALRSDLRTSQLCSRLKLHLNRLNFNLCFQIRNEDAARNDGMLLSRHQPYRDLRSHPTCRWTFAVHPKTVQSDQRGSAGDRSGTATEDQLQRTFSTTCRDELFRF